MAPERAPAPRDPAPPRDPAAEPRDPAAEPRDPAAEPRDPAAEPRDPVSPRDSAPLLHAGRVGRPHGLDGSFHVTQPRAALLELGRTLLLGDREEQIVRRAGTDARPIVRLAGCTSRTAAEALRGADLHVPQAEAPLLEEDEFWPEELEGCAVHDGARDVGVVRTLRALPSCEVLEVERPNGPDLLVPLIRDAVRAVDLDARRIDVDLAFLDEA
jgi:16S rRNA processing protein RimM